MAFNNETRKPQMRVMMPCEVFHFSIPKPEYEHMDEEDVISEYDDDFSCSSVHSMCDSCVTHETEHDHGTDGPQSDDSTSTHHQDHDQEYGEIYGPEPLSPPRYAAYFDCKLCLKMAREPVVTLCGHLYCRDCLDKWLHFFTSHMECPVCHSKVFDSSIVPIKPTPVCDRDLSSGFNVPPPTPKGGFAFEEHSIL